MEYSTQTRAPHPSQGFSLVELTSLSLANVMSSNKLSPRQRPGSSRRLLWIPACAGMTNGFSLVELSIVLVILGLLTGGILTGQNLIRAAELRSIVTEFQNYQTAVYTFRDKYFALPGDMTNATDFWGTATGCPNDGTTSGVCNGNGDGVIASASGAMIHHCENQEFWRHLAKAGLIEGNYTTNVAANCYIHAEAIGVTFPRTKLSNVGVTVSYAGTIVTSGSFPGNFMYPGNYEHIFMFGQPGMVNGLTARRGFATEEAWNIDTKIDDGKPAYGNVTSILLGPYDNTCATSATPTSAEYDLSNDNSDQCTLIIKTGF